ncbi:hypothetical protein PR202_gb22111 [Eleusine coracana subsp. coracana]|uniref:pyruvate decarboxylase n=1 Tax=Eleusine coracana subsp. coracana TaxID=191504 RepID=A0AAV5FFQ6_ELECO|nr:hypothetical protein PR202_gb22111 [Eleusine coracana subsp. coracana]
MVDLAEASGYAVATMPSAKGLVPETLPRFIGTYWGAVSTAFCAEIVESADAYLFAGPIFNDYSSVGYSFLLKKDKAVIVQPDRVTVGNGPTFGCVMMKDFLAALAGSVTTQTPPPTKTTGGSSCRRGSRRRASLGSRCASTSYSSTYRRCSPETARSSQKRETRGSTARSSSCHKDAATPTDCCRYEFQMQYGSIGCDRESFSDNVCTLNHQLVEQVTAQDVSTMLRCDQKSIIFLINNGGYTIEVEIHDGLYNVIKNWNYTALIDAIHNGDGNCWTTKVTCEEELTEAVHTATGHNKDCLCFIEVIAHKDDTSKELLEWGSRVCAANSRPPNPQ